MTTLRVDEFLSLAKEGVIIDVRSPKEFEKGHIVSAHNMPLFNDEERAEVGTLYVRKSREAAIERGLEIVGPKMAHFVREAKRLSAGTHIYLYCWRGGMRSGSVAWLLETAGLKVSLLNGGYKRFRRDFDKQVDRLSSAFVVLSGFTGSGKSDILETMEAMGEQMVDLEKLASHRGSVFGAFGLDPQPTTEQFQNLIYDKIRHMSPDRAIWFEGESAQIGRVYIPPCMFAKLSCADTINYNVPREKRVERLVKVYGSFDKQMYIEAFNKIQKRLGGLMTQQAKEMVESGDMATAADIALNYYDSGYSSSSAKRSGTVYKIDYTEGSDRDNALNIIKIYNETKKEEDESEKEN